jgi:(p)ppGpp synthase/HD superfamily hydrolase
VEEGAPVTGIPAAIDRAEAFAHGAHAGQKYGHVTPYTKHLEMAVQVLYEHIRDNEMSPLHFTILAQATWLHDTLEDTRVVFDDLAGYFGTVVAGIVEAVTDRPGKSRRERHQKTYPLIRRYGSDAVAVKLADRIANVTYSLSNEDAKKLKMYRNEYPFFRANLWHHEQPEYVRRMFLHLDELLGWEAATFTFKGELR